MDPNQQYLGGIPIGLAFQTLGLAQPQPDAPVSSPDQTPGVDAFSNEAPVQPLPVSQGANVSAGVEQKGFSGAKNDQIEARAKRPGGIYGRLADISQAQQQNLTELGQQSDQVAAEGKAAVGAEVQAEQAKIVKQGQQNAELADMNQKMAAEESRQSALAASKVQQQMANYEAALNDFRAARVDPSQLWHSMGTGDQVGMLATAFVHDFLGVRGIHTSAMDTFNRAVDQNISAQVENIRKKGQVAEGFKSLWQMAVDQSRTEAEARIRVRGYMLESFKDKVAGELAGYDSDLARAKGLAAIANIDGESLKVKTDLSKIWQENANADKSAAVSIYGHQLAASATTESARIAAGARQAEAMAKMREDAQKTAVRNPENSPGQVVFGPDGLPHQLPGRTQVLGFANTPEEAAKTQGELNDVFNNIREANSYIKELKQIGGKHYQGPFANRLQSADAARVDVLRRDLTTSLAKIRGGVRADASPQLLAMYDQFYRPADWTSVDSLDKAIATATAITQGASQLAITDAATLRHGSNLERQLAGEGLSNEASPIGANASAPGAYAPRIRTELNANATNLGTNPADNAPAIQTAKNIQNNTAPDTLVAQDDYKGEIVDKFVEANKAGDHLHDPSFQRDIHNREVGRTDQVEVPGWASLMMDLANQATPNAKSTNPVFRSLPDQYTPAERQKALEMLQEFASGGGVSEEGVDKISPDQILFAQYMLSEVLHEPMKGKNAR